MKQVILEYIHRPNKTEVGYGKNTHDSYLKLASPIENSKIFTMDKTEAFYNSAYDKMCTFKAIKYNSGGKEYRLTKLGEVRKSILIECGDDMIFRRVILNGKEILQLDINHYNKVMIYSASKGKFTVVYPERLPNWNEDGTTFHAIYKGKNCKVEIPFLEKRHKRSDSPDVTPLYGITINGIPYEGNTLYINIEGSIPCIEEKCKWELHEFSNI